MVEFLATAIQLYSFVLLARILISWIPNVDRDNPIVQFVYQMTEPVLEPIRRSMPPMGMVDISPIIVFIGLHILRILLFNLAKSV